MSKSTIAKKAVSAKVIAQVTKTFEELSGSKTSKKTARQISRSARRLVKTIHSQIKKLEKKRARLAKKKAKEAKIKAKNNGKSKVARKAKTPVKVKKVPVN